MRPGRLGPGRAAVAEEVGYPVSGFNEAGAIRPRKGRQVLPELLKASRFNEAGAIRPRKADYVFGVQLGRPKLQ